MKLTAVSLLVPLVAFSDVTAFTTSPASSIRSTVSLRMSSEKNEAQPPVSNVLEPWRKALTASSLAATLLANSFLTPPAPAVAMEKPLDASTNIVLSARSGGRMGGRSAFRAPSRPSSARRYGTTIRSRTYITPPPVVIGSPFGSPFGFGYGYNPLGGFGLGYGLGAMNNAGDTIRDYRQESEIQRDRAELEVARERAQELEQRVKALEEQQKSEAPATDQ